MSVSLLHIIALCLLGAGLVLGVICFILGPTTPDRIVAADTLSILITARYLNPGLFTVVRKNQQKKAPIFKAADIGLIMQPGTLVAQNILGLILSPLLGDFFRLTREQNEEWANVLVSRIAGVVA